MFTKTTWSGRVLAALSFFLCAQPSMAQVTVTTVPRDIDSSNQAGWWRPLVVRGNDTYFAFNAPHPTANKHYVKFGKWDGTNWTFGFLKNADGTAWVDPNQNDDIGHTQPTMAIDGDGVIHVWADGHDEPWQYFRSTSALDVTDIRRAQGMPGSVAFTYPVAATAPNGDVYLMIRNHAGGIRGRGELYHWNDNTNAWRHVGQFAAQTSNAVVYPDGMHIDDIGDVHLVFSWAYLHARGLRHYGSYLRYDVSHDVFRNSWDTVVSIPVNISTPNLLYYGLQGGETFDAADTGIGLQSATVAVDNLRRPSIVFRHRPTAGTGDLDFNVYRIRWNGSNWVDKVTIHTAANDCPAALGHSHNGTRVRAYFATTGSGLMMAENTSSWIPQALDSTKAVRRLSAVARNSTTDIVYGSAPTEIDANTGRLYLFEVP
jgi:hypothetical protein